MYSEAFQKWMLSLYITQQTETISETLVIAKAGQEPFRGYVTYEE
jgi:hypothetical protein